MSDKRYYFMKLEQDYFSSKAMRVLRKMPYGADMLVVYLKMQLRYLNSDGVIKFENMLDTLEDEIAMEIDERVEIVETTLNALKKWGLIEVKNDNELFLSESQKRVGSYTQSTIRQQRFKENQKQKELENKQSVTKALPKALESNAKALKNNEIKEKEKELEKREKNNKEKINKKESLKEIVASYTCNESLRNALIEFIEMRKTIRKPLTAYAMKINLNELNRLTSEEETKIAIVNQSVKKGWQSFYAISGEKQNNKNKSNQFLDMLIEKDVS